MPLRITMKLPAKETEAPAEKDEYDDKINHQMDEHNATAPTSLWSASAQTHCWSAVLLNQLKCAKIHGPGAVSGYAAPTEQRTT